MDEKKLARLVLVIDEFRKLYPEMSAHTIEMFIEVAAKQGRTVKELAEKIDVTSSTASRNVSLLRTPAPGKEGLNLLDLQEDGVAKRVYLSPQGKTLAERITTLLA